MLIRARTALLFASLSVASPSQADLAPAPAPAAAPHASSAAGESPCDLAFGCDGTQSAAANSDPFSGLEEPTAEVAESHVDIEASAVELAAVPIALEPLAAELALMPEFFLDPNEDETFASIANDLAAAGELVTGSLSAEAPAASAPFALDYDLLSSADEPTTFSRSLSSADEQAGDDRYP